MAKARRGKKRSIGDALADRVYKQIGHFPRVERGSAGRAVLSFWFKSGDALRLDVVIKMLERFPLQTASYVIACYMGERNDKRGGAVDWRDVEITPAGKDDRAVE